MNKRYGLKGRMWEHQGVGLKSEVEHPGAQSKLWHHFPVIGQGRLSGNSP